MAYATLAELKTQLGITASDTSRDSQLTDVLDAATAAIDDQCHRTFTAAAGSATARVFNPHHDGRVILTGEGEELVVPDIGSTTGLVVETGNATDGWTAVTAASIEAVPIDALTGGRPYTGLLYLLGCWPTTAGQRVRVTADWGWPATPDVVHQAALILAGRLWKRKDSPEGVLGSAEWGVIRLSRVDPDVATLLAPVTRGLVQVG